MASFEFTEDEVPYGILGEYGLTREMVEDLPENPYQYILRGLLSPALPIRVRDDKGNTVTARTRFRLVRTDDGSVDVLFYPRLMHCDLESYSSKEQNLLMRDVSSSAMRRTTMPASASSRSTRTRTRSCTSRRRSSGGTS